MKRKSYVVDRIDPTSKTVWVWVSHGKFPAPFDFSEVEFLKFETFVYIKPNIRQ